MKLFVNNESIELTESAKISELLGQLSYADKKGIAVAINEAVVPKIKWTEYTLNENDKVLIIQATQGG